MFNIAMFSIMLLNTGGAEPPPVLNIGMLNIAMININVFSIHQGTLAFHRMFAGIMMLTDALL